MDHLLYVESGRGGGVVVAGGGGVRWSYSISQGPPQSD